MKSKYKIMLFLIAFAMAGTLTNCSDDSEGGTPMISYIRVTDPLASDSLLVTAGQGKMIAIIGRNLQNVQQVWFNDQRATLTATFVSNTSIITKVPDKIPQTVTNEMKLIFANGRELIYDFTVDISKPRVDRLKSEYVNEGDVATIYGDFFYEPVTVTFTGGVSGQLVSVKHDVVEVKVPAGAQPGPITVTTNFGQTESTFWFRDNRDIIASFDIPLVNSVWQGPANITATKPGIIPISGKFIAATKELSAWPFFEWYGGPKEGDIGVETRNIPQEALTTPTRYSLKFEVNTLKSLAGAYVRIHIGTADNGTMDAQRQAMYYIWQPNLNTNGQWETITIPWVDVYTANQKFAYSSTGYSMFIYFHGPNAASANLALDNMRVVPNTAE
jgi:hypothetical protein